MGLEGRATEGLLKFRIFLKVGVVHADFIPWRAKRTIWEALF